MTQDNHNSMDHLLDLATQRVRHVHDLEIPPGLVESTVEAIRQQAIRTSRFSGHASRTLRWSGVAAALLIVLAGAITFFTYTGDSVAFAQAIERAKRAESVEFVLIQGREEDATAERRCLVQGDMMRVQHPQGIVTLIDTKAGQRLYLDAKNKTAGRFTLPKQIVAELAVNPIEQLQQVRSAGAEPLGKEDLEGRNVAVFRVAGIKLFGTHSEQGEMRIWVDSATMLPARIELRRGVTTILIFKNMKWNQAIDPAQLKLEVPEGYTEQSEETFQKRLRPDKNGTTPLTPAEAFRKWHGSGK